MAGFLDEIRSYVGWSDEDAAALRRLEPALPRILDDLVDDFYAAILAHDEPRKVLADEAQLARLKQSLREWATSLLAGPHDEAWFELRSRIGRRHVEVGLPQRYMPLAMSRVRGFLVRLAVEREGRDAAQLARTLAAVEKVLDLELTIMLESYHELHQGRVRQAERLSTLGRLAASVSHELKNPLAVINTSLLLIRRQLELPEAGRDRSSLATHMERIARSSKLAARMASQLLDYARSKRPVVRLVRLSALLEDALAMVDEREGVAIDARTEPADASARLDATDVSHVVANLVRNAVQSIRESGAGGRVTVRARRDPLGVRLVVTDDGPGIPPENLERIFEPLFTTRPTGTGLGLSISRDLIEAHGGRLTVASTVGRGAVFTVMLPQETGGAEFA